MDRVLTNEEKMKLLETIVLNGNLSEIEKVFIDIKNSNSTANKEVETNINKTSPNNFDGASIYAKEALPFVNEDKKNHPIVSNNPSVEEEVPSEEKEGPVLKKTIPNPWGESGAKRVTPGQTLDY